MKQFLTLFSLLILTLGSAFAEIFYDDSDADDLANAFNAGVLLNHQQGPATPWSGSLSGGATTIYIVAHGNNGKCSGKDPVIFADLLADSNLTDGSRIIFHSCSAGEAPDLFLNPLAEQLYVRGYRDLNITGANNTFVPVAITPAPFYGVVPFSTARCDNTTAVIDANVTAYYDVNHSIAILKDRRDNNASMTFEQWSLMTVSDEFNLTIANNTVYTQVNRAGCYQGNAGWVSVEAHQP